MAKQSPDGGRQAPGGFFYDMAQGQENWPMSCRCRKIGIRQKSAGHRAIYVLLGRSQSMVIYSKKMVALICCLC